MLVLTRDTALGFLNPVTVAPVASTVRDIPSELCLDEDDGLLNPCAANFDNLVTAPKVQVGELIATLPFEKMLDAERAIRFALGFGMG